jgi:hypothetical protein
MKNNNQKENNVIENLVYDKLGQEVLTKHNERFKGSSVVDTHEYQKGQPISYATVPRILSYNQILREIAPNTHVIGPDDYIEFSDSVADRDSTYAHTNSIVMYPRDEVYDLESDLQRNIENVMSEEFKQLWKPLEEKYPNFWRPPVRIVDLGVKKSDNKRGFEFEKIEDSSLELAHYLSETGPIHYDPLKGFAQREAEPREAEPHKTHPMHRYHWGHRGGRGMDPNPSGAKPITRASDFNFPNLYNHISTTFDLLSGSGNSRVEIIKDE